MIDDDDWLNVADAFHAAAVDGDGWYEALAEFAAATGSSHGQLVCMVGNTDALNVLTGVDPGLQAAFLAAGGTDPRFNPRRRAGISRPPLTVIAESDFITPEAIKRHPHYQDFAMPWDVPFICLTTLERREKMLVGLAVIRSRRQGHIDAAGRRVFATLAPHVRAAVRTNLALGAHREALLADALEKVAVPAFICDAAGRVVRLTPSADALCRAGGALRLRSGRLSAARAPENNALAAAIAAAVRLEPGAAPQSLVLHARTTDDAAVMLDILPLPRRRLDLRFDARVLLIVRGAGTDAGRRASLLRQSYGLTEAEIAIAMQLLEGLDAENIARQRGVSVGTVRVQIKSLLAKVGVRRQMELVARLVKM